MTNCYKKYCWIHFFN